MPNDEQIRILTFCHSEACGGHFSARKIADKILQLVFTGLPYIKIVSNFEKLVLGANN